jgi:hypothetical protein
VGLNLRAASADEDDAIADVIAASFPDNPKSRPEILRWQYADNPFGDAVRWVWEEDDRLVAHYTSVPLPALLRGRPATIGIGIDAAVVPDYQGRKLFVPLARALYEDTGRHGMPVTVCYPNENSVRGITAAGWTSMGVLRTHVLALDPRWLAEQARLPAFAMRPVRRVAFSGVPRSAGVVACEVEGPPPGLDRLWDDVAGSVVAGVRRDASWWRWRYRDRPGAGTYRYFEARKGRRLVGAALTTVQEAAGAQFAYVLELLSPSPGPARALVHAMTEPALADGAVGLAVATLPGTDLARLATLAGFRRLPARMEPKRLHVGFVDNTGTNGDLHHVRWSFAWGDLDHL